MWKEIRKQLISLLDQRESISIRMQVVQVQEHSTQIPIALFNGHAIGHKAKNYNR